MSWEDLASSLRRRARNESEPTSTASAIASVARLAALAGVIVAAIVTPATALVAATATQAADDVLSLPLELTDGTSPQTSRLYAAGGELLAYFYEENRQEVPLEKISPVMQEAILAIEDRRFYEHGALDLEGTLRALLNNAAEGQTQGGSTITQQLVKLILVQQAVTEEQRKAATEQSVARKVRELRLAVDYEKKHSKDEILARYLNIAYFGDGAYGIAAAASHYFSVTPEELTVPQAATLAGLVKNPVEFDPSIYPERALQRRNTVLSVMAEQGKISQQESEDLQATDLGLNVTEYPNGCVTSQASFACDYIRRYLLEDPALGATEDERRERLERGGLTIKTNIDLGMQVAANEAVAANVQATDQAIGALAMVEPGTGKVKGLAQSRPMGRDKAAGQSFINFTVPTEYGQSLGFQAGSTFKIFTAAAALQQGIGVNKTYNSPPDMTVPAGTYFDCEGGGTSPWEVSNSTTSGTKNMYSGLRESVNTYFAQLERDAGLCNVVRMAEAMGIKVPSSGPENAVVPSFTLGPLPVSPLDMAAAYAVPASGGMYCKPLPVTEVLDINGETIKTYEPECNRAMSPEVAAQLNDILRGLQQPGGFGYNAGTGLNVPSAAKTGTTNDNKSVWYTGYTPELSTAAMIAGADIDGTPINLAGVQVNGRIVSYNEAAGSALAGPMWAAAMRAIQNFLSPVDFQPPPRQGPAPRPRQAQSRAPAADPAAAPAP